VLPPFCAAAHGDEATPLIAVVIELEDLRGRACNRGRAGDGDVILECLPEGPKLFIVAVCIGGNLLDEAIQVCEFSSRLLHGVRLPLLAPHRSQARSRRDGFSAFSTLGTMRSA
jgi:hypothetical protein